MLAQMFCLSSLVPKIQILERLDQSMVRVVRLCKEDIDLENPHGLVLYQGVPSIVPSNANHAFNGNI